MYVCVIIIYPIYDKYQYILFKISAIMRQKIVVAVQRWSLHWLSWLWTSDTPDIAGRCSWTPMAIWVSTMSDFATF